MTQRNAGANSYGQLSQGHCDDQLVPREVTHVKGEDIQTVTGGGGHTLVITNNGILQACGSNNKGQLGLGHLADVKILTTIPRFASASVVQVAAGWDFTLVVTDLGDVYSFGSNAFGQLGNSALPQKSSTPAKIDMPEDSRIVEVAAGLRHSVALSDTGVVYCWGSSKKGQCGCMSVENPGLKIVTPTKVTIPEIKGKLISVAAGSYHTSALSDEGEILLWGCNKYGQTTQSPDTQLLVNQPYLVPRDSFGGKQIRVVKSGWTHLIAQTDTGEIYSWGRADYGQLGRSLPEGTLHSHTPGLIQSSENMVDFQCGSEHALFLSGKQKCFAVGWNEHGLCGTGDEENVRHLQLVETLCDYSVIQIGCGGGHCFVITTDTV